MPGMPGKWVKNEMGRIWGDSFGMRHFQVNHVNLWRVMATVLQLLLFSSSPLLMKASPSLPVNGSSVQMQVVRTRAHTHDKATRVANTLPTRQACAKVAVLSIRSESNRSINWIHTVFVNVHGTSHKKSTELILKKGFPSTSINSTQQLGFLPVGVSRGMEQSWLIHPCCSLAFWILVVWVIKGLILCSFIGYRDQIAC